MKICPGADPTDGLLELTVVTAISRTKLLRVFPTVYTGAHVDLPQVLTFRAKRVEVSGPDLQGFGDGEPVGPFPLELQVRPLAVRFAALPSGNLAKGGST
jgi:diacylglycerol kinase (ATP)